MNYPQRSVSQQHGIFLSAGKGSIYFRVTVIIMSCQMDRLLIQWCCTGTVHLILHCQINGLTDIKERSIATLLLYFTPTEVRLINSVKIINIGCSESKNGFCNIMNGMNLQIQMQKVGSLLHNLGISHHNRSAQFVSFLARKHSRTDLRSDTGRVTHGDG